MDVIVVIGIGAAVAIGVIVFLHYKKSKSVPAAVAATQVDIMGVVSKLTDALHVANKTTAMQATVIASPPVQAVINSAAPTPAVPAPVAATPVAAPVPTTPAPSYTGPFFDINGNPDPKGQYTADNWKRAHDEAGAATTERVNGPVAVSSLSDGDKAFLLYAQENYTLPGSELFYAVCNGIKSDVDAAISWADNHRGQVKADPRLAGFVDSYSKGLLRPVYS